MEDGLNLMETRLSLDKQYAKAWHEGRRICKKSSHKKKLIEYFNANPIWDYTLKVTIAKELGMTFNQISKWNWDQRKKMGIIINRRKLPSPTI